DAVHVEADIAIGVSANESGGDAQGTARAGLSAVLQHEFARSRHRVAFVQIGGIHTNALVCLPMEARWCLSAPPGVFVDAGNRLGKAGKGIAIVLSGQASRISWARHRYCKACSMAATSSRSLPP